MKISIKNTSFKIFFWLTISLFFILCAFTTKYLINQHTSITEYAKTVEKNLINESLLLDKEFSSFKKDIIKTDSINFDELKKTSPHHFYVYKNGKLIFWNQNKYIIDHYHLTGHFVEKIIIDHKKSFFLVKKKWIKHKNEGTLEIFAILPLYIEHRISNKFLEPFYAPSIFPNNKVSLSLEMKEGEKIFSEINSFLFSISFSSDIPLSYEEKSSILILGILSIVCAIIALYYFIIFLTTRHQKHWGITALIFGLGGIRVLMIILEFPSSFFDNPLFNPRGFSSSIINPNAVDLFLNIVCLNIIAGYLFIHYKTILNYKYIVKSSRLIRYTIIYIFAFLSYLGAHFLYNILETVYQNSSDSIDISNDFNFSVFKIVCYAIFALSTIIYFYLSHVSARMISKLTKYLAVSFTGLILAGITYLAFLSFTENIPWEVIIINTTYIITVILLQLPNKLSTTSFKGFMYYMVCSFSCALLASYSIKNFHDIKEINNKDHLGLSLLVENDIMIEYLLTNDVKNKITNDKFITKNFSGVVSSNKMIKNKITRYYLGKDFENYDIRLLFYDKKGQPKEHEEYDFYTYHSMINSDQDNKTTFEQLYLIKQTNLQPSKYIYFITFSENNLPIGHIIIELKKKEYLPNSIYPSLLIDKQHKDIEEQKKYSYAIFDEGQLILSKGGYNYTHEILSLFKKTHTHDIQTAHFKGFDHVLSSLPESNRKVIVSSVEYGIRNLLANFSFFFLILLGSIFIISTTYNYFIRKDNIKINYVTRIQFYLNVAYLLPLLVVSLVISGILSYINKHDTTQEYIRKNASACTALYDSFVKYNTFFDYSNETLEQVLEVASLTQTDLNIYEPKGKLIFASQPSLFDQGIFTKYLPPKVMTNLVEGDLQQVIMEEKIGHLTYTTAYRKVTSFENGKTLGIVSVPFFDAEITYRKQISWILSNILIIFTLMFIALLFMAYFASNQLTLPLQIITQKIKKITVTGRNDLIEYHSDDEIGLLVGEYNKMIVKLEASVEALARNEKETAWREMAKQVAHEIKNPLTPMKLTLQQLQRVIDKDEGRIHKSIKSLLTQIDTLSDIATSFSEFAKLPIPKREKFDIGTVLRHILTLYETDQSVDLSHTIEKGKFDVLADEKQMGRVFTNLILNGIQAVHVNERPNIFVSLEKIKKTIRISIQDNGEGIPEDIQSKVFIPNFSTKYTGSGIGLAVAKRGIENAGGKIWFETSQNGTTFFIEMPLSSTTS